MISLEVLIGQQGVTIFRDKVEDIPACLMPDPLHKRWEVACPESGTSFCKLPEPSSSLKHGSSKNNSPNMHPSSIPHCSPQRYKTHNILKESSICPTK